MPCICCGREGGVFHHLLADSPSKAGRRDHCQVVPLYSHNHAELHTIYGNELAWQDNYGLDFASEAQFLRLQSVEEGLL
jgi:hypothetical protein